MTDLRPAPVSRGDLAGQLEPVRAALLADADLAAEQILGAARADAEKVVSRARSESDEAVEHARRRAVASARAQSDLALATARREAHASVLRAAAALRHDLAEQVYAAAEALPNDPRYPALLDRLETLARLQLGQDSLVTRDPPGGGVIALAGCRRVDYRLRALADLALDAIGDEVILQEQPWH